MFWSNGDSCCLLSHYFVLRTLILRAVHGKYPSLAAVPNSFNPNWILAEKNYGILQENALSLANISSAIMVVWYVAAYSKCKIFIFNSIYRACCPSFRLLQNHPWSAILACIALNKYYCSGIIFIFNYPISHNNICSSTFDIL